MRFKKIMLFFSAFFDPPVSVGALFDNRYMIIRHLGTGGYGHSYLVIDQETECRLVLKTLRLHRRLFKSGRQSFETEKELLMSIIHPGFPKFEQSGTYRKIPYYTMEFIEGKNFEQLIFDEGKRYSELEAFKIVYQLLPLIQVLHSKNIIHRDIRIPNVITNHLNLWLLDLGLAVETSRPHLPNERSQEIISRKQTDFQADFYSLGHFLLFLLYSDFTFPNGRKPKSWEEELEISRNSKHIIQRLLDIKTPYQNCGQIQKDIENLILNEEENNVIF